MGSINHIKTSTVADGANTDLIRPSDWNSIHNYTLQDCASILTAGNTTGTMSNISSGTLYLAGTNGITLSQNGNSVSIVDSPLVSQWQPQSFYQPALATNSTLGISTLYFQPVDIDCNISASRLNFYLNITHTYSGAPSNSTGWLAAGYGLYTQMTGTGSDRISLLTSYSMSYVSASVCSSTIYSGTQYIGLSNATSHSTQVTTVNNANASSYPINSIDGFRVLAFPLNLTLSPQRYYLGFSNQISNQGASLIFSNSVIQQTIAMPTFRPFGTSSAASNASFYGNVLGFGTYSAASAGWPASIPLTSDSIRAAAVQTCPLFNISGYSYTTNWL